MEPKFLSWSFANFITVNSMVLIMALLIVYGIRFAKRNQQPGA